MSEPAFYEPKSCPACSSRLEEDGMCLVCLLKDGIGSVGAAASSATAASPTRTLQLPCEFAGYRLVREIASGGMGIVYEAEDVKLKRVVALKAIRNAIFATREEVARFKAETHAVAQLDHPDIVPIYESGEEGGLPYYTMRLAEGGSLADRLKKRGVLPDREAAQLMVRIARAVQHAHDHGVLHRDLKPANILLDVAGKPMLSDFGLAKLLDAEFQLTRTQAYVGTPHYMSPEQAAGKARQVTTASDVWALGVMLYQMLTDKLPFQGGSAVEVMRRITEEEPEISSTGKLVSRSRDGKERKYPKNGKDLEIGGAQTACIQRDLATLILRCLEKQPARRLSSAAFLADELESFLEGRPLHSRRVGSFERLWKFTLRHKAAAVAVVGISLSLAGGTVVSVWQAVQATEARQVALKQKDESDEIANIVLSTVHGLDEASVGRDVDAAELRMDLLRRVRNFGGDPARKASMLASLSPMLRKPEHLRQFRTLLAELEPQLAEDQKLLWDMRYCVAVKSSVVFRTEEDKEMAKADMRRVLTWQRAHLRPDDASISATCLSLADQIVRNHSTDDDLHEAEALLREARAAGQRRRDPLAVVDASINLMTVVFGLGRQEEALKLGRESCQFAMDEFGEGHAATGRAHGRLARHCREAGKIDESIMHTRRALDIYWHTVGPGYVKAVASLNALGETLEKKGDIEGHLQLRRDALRACDQQHGPLDMTTLDQAAKVIELLRALGRMEEAQAIGELWTDRVRVDGLPPPAAIMLLWAHWSTQIKAGREQNGRRLLDEIMCVFKKEQGDDYARVLRWASVGKLLWEHGHPAQAQVLLAGAARFLEGSDFEKRSAKLELSKIKELLRLTQQAQAAGR